MKTIFTVVFLTIVYSSAEAQTPVTGIFTHRVNATTPKNYAGTGATGLASSGFASNSYIYQFGTTVGFSNILLLDSFVALGMNYRYQAATLVTKFRRVNNATVTGARKSLWFEQNSSTQITTAIIAKMLPDYDDSLERIFSKGNVLNIGMDNNFQNASTTNNNNIERVDYLIPGGVKATDATKAGFTVFDRGSGGSHDPFYIAAVKTLDANGDPSSYYNAVSVASTNFGSNVGPALNYLILRKNPSDAALGMMNNSTSQNLDGTLIRFSDLGVPNNTNIYGYSLFAPDVTVSPATNLVDYTNATNFPTNTDLTSGGIDQIAVAGVWVTNASFIVLSERVDNFLAEWTGDKVQLTWTLGKTDGLKQLVVERSPDGRVYTPLLHFYAPLNGLQSVSDDQPLPGKNFYRLQLVNDDDKVITYSSVSGVSNKIATTLSLNIYPNPVTHHKLTFHGQGLENGTYDLRIINMAGLIVVQQDLKGAPAFTKDLFLPEKLQTGVYTLLLTDNRGNKVFTKTILLQ